MPECRFIAIHIFVLTILAQTLSPNLLDDLNVIPEYFYKTTNLQNSFRSGSASACSLRFVEHKISSPTHFVLPPPLRPKLPRESHSFDLVRVRGKWSRTHADGLWYLPEVFSLSLLPSLILNQLPILRFGQKTQVSKGKEFGQCDLTLTFTKHRSTVPFKPLACIKNHLVQRIYQRDELNHVLHRIFRRRIFNWRCAL